jgi:flagellar basal-body rod protein FlgC
MSRFFSATDISASGLSAERMRMEVVANNIANAYTTRTPQGGPYRRQQVVFASQYEAALAEPFAHSQPRGVRVVGIRPDLSPLQQVYQPGHPDADGEGMVLMPNVRPAMEMVDLITASRAYEANLQALRSFRQMAEQTLSLLRS